MKRLTKKISKTVQDKYSLGSYLQYDFANADDINKLLNKLGKFEDFMEEQDFESLEHLAFTLEEQNKIIDAYEQENQALKDRWQKLKECVDKELQKDIKRSDLKHESFVICEQFVLDKMQELEEEE